MIKNFTIEELTKSITAKRKGIDNTPNDETIQTLNKLAEQLQIIRDEYGKPIVISSGFRCEELNKLVGGAKNSDHLYGAAADFHSLSDKLVDNKTLWDVIMKLNDEGKLDCRQIIWEYGTKENGSCESGPDWIHISVNNKYKCQIHNNIVYVL